MNPHNTTQTRVRLIILGASESTSEFERLATDYNTGRVKTEFGAVHHSYRICIHDLMNSVRALLNSVTLRQRGLLKPNRANKGEPI
jgi:hypothetical protein